MPTYTYQCAWCGSSKEIFRSYDIGDAVEPKCEKCNVEMMRVFQPTPVHFKGEGWYVKDKYNPDAAHG